MSLFISLTIATLLLPAALDASLDGNKVWGAKNSTGDPYKCAQQGGSMGEDLDWVCDLDHHWCERLQWGRFVRTPINAYSALSFVVVAWLVLAITLSERWSRVHREPTRPINHMHAFESANFIVVACLCWGGIASFWNHAAVTHWSREPDRASIWALVVFPAASSLLRFAQCPAPACLYHMWAGAVALVVFAAAIGHMAFGAESESAVPFIILGLLLITTICGLIARPLCASDGVLCFKGLCLQKSTGHCSILALAVACFCGSVLLQNPATLFTCNPDGPWIGKTHAWWHVLQSLGLLALWWYFRTEQLGEGGAPFDCSTADIAIAIANET